VSPQEIAAIVDAWYRHYACFSRIDEDVFLALRNRLVPLKPGDSVQFREPGRARWFSGTVQGPVDSPDDPHRSGDVVVCSRSGRQVPVFLGSVRRQP
jgi:hypothetical protein